MESSKAAKSGKRHVSTTHQTLIEHVWAHFQATGDWPTVQQLHSILPDVNVRLEATRLGTHLIDCDFKSAGACQLEFAAIADFEDSEGPVQNFLGAVRFLARRYSEQEELIDGSEIAGALELNELAHRKVMRLLLLPRFAWTLQGNWSELKYQVLLTPSIASFRAVSSLPEFFDTVQRAKDEESEIAARHQGPRIRPPKAPAAKTPSFLASPPSLSDPALDAVLQADLQELRSLWQASAWKATILLAGSCIEAVLLDICKAGPGSREALGKKPEDASASELAKVAIEQNWVSADHEQLLDFIRRWRNTIHPGRALKKKQATQPLAEMIVSMLGYLLDELPDRDST